MLRFCLSLRTTFITIYFQVAGVWKKLTQVKIAAINSFHKTQYVYFHLQNPVLFILDYIWLNKEIFFQDPHQKRDLHLLSWRVIFKSNCYQKISSLIWIYYVNFKQTIKSFLMQFLFSENFKYFLLFNFIWNMLKFIKRCLIQFLLTVRDLYKWNIY